MRRLPLCVLGLALAACSTHRVDDCFAPCDAVDQGFFAECVASGLAGECEPGNRRCCALATECVGALDDQTVETTRPVCEVFAETQCWPPCTESDEAEYDACVESGSGPCMIAGDETCCVGESNCIGTLGDWYLDAEGCCADESDCDSGERCDDMTFSCVEAAIGCGDGVITSPERCDDGNTTTEACTYGAMSCLVCGAGCTQIAGATSYCGDDAIDGAAGEECDPPSSACDSSCHDVSVPATCSNGSLDGLETDVDCGGAECMGCRPDQVCEVDSDCRVVNTECTGARASCARASLTCMETYDCDDGDTCTTDVCESGVGCLNTMIDDDSDGFGPLDIGCGRDCDDADGEVFPGATEICDGLIDHNCDGNLDESC